MPDDVNIPDEPESDEGGSDEAGVDAPGDAADASGAQPDALEPGAGDPSATVAPSDDGETVAAADGPAEVLVAAGGAADTLPAFVVRAAEVLLVAIESALGKGASIAATTTSLTDYETAQSEFAERDHIGLELRVAITETEAQLAAVLIPLDAAGALFSLELSAEQLADEGFATAQLETLSNAIRELLDLVSLTLFTDGLSDGEITLSAARNGQVDFTLGMLQDVAQGSPPARMDVTLSLPDGQSAELTLLVPISLLTRVAESLAAGGSPAEGAESDVPELEGTAVPSDGAAGAPGNISPFPEFGGGEEAASGESGPAPAFGIDPETPVHPLRFPPLPSQEAQPSMPRPIDLIMDVTMRVTVELGRSAMAVEDLLQLGPGSVVELNKLAGEPVDILVNESLIARGEVVVVDENFGARVTEIVSPLQRATAQGR